MTTAEAKSAVGQMVRVNPKCFRGYGKYSLRARLIAVSDNGRYGFIKPANHKRTERMPVESLKLSKSRGARVVMR